jgi:hypothetical protein
LERGCVDNYYINDKESRRLFAQRAGLVRAWEAPGHGQTSTERAGCTMGVMDRDYVREAPRWHRGEHGEMVPASYNQYNDAMATAQRLAAPRTGGTTRTMPPG